MRPVILFLLIIFSLLQNWLWLGFLLVVVFSIWYKPVYLIPLAILVDGYFGSFHFIPVFSLLSVLWYVLVEGVRPRIADFKNT
jgi:hypothetical protein